MGLRNAPEGNQRSAVDGCKSFGEAGPSQRKCDQKIFSRRGRVLSTFIVLTLFFISLQAYTSARSAKKMSQPATNSIGAILGKYEVKGYAERFIKAHLDLPPSARFSDWSNGLAVKPLETGPLYYRIEIKGWVAFQNQFGLVIRRDYQCIISKRTNDDIWKLEELKLQAIPQNWMACMTSDSKNVRVQPKTVEILSILFR